MRVTGKMIEDMSALLRADTEAALASITHSRILAESLGIELPGVASSAARKPHQTGRRVYASKGKSKPNLAGWLRRATEDGTLPVPTDVLIVKDRMVQQGLVAGYISGEGHPYRITQAGKAYATANFKGRLVQRG